MTWPVEDLEFVKQFADKVDKGQMTDYWAEHFKYLNSEQAEGDLDYVMTPENLPEEKRAEQEVYILDYQVSDDLTIRIETRKELADQGVYLTDICKACQSVHFVMNGDLRQCTGCEFQPMVRFGKETT